MYSHICRNVMTFPCSLGYGILQRGDEKSVVRWVDFDSKNHIWTGAVMKTTMNRWIQFAGKGVMFTSLVLSPLPSMAAPSAPDQPGYDDQRAESKLQILQQQIEATEYQRLPQWTGTEPLAMFALSLNPIRSMVRSFFNVTLDRNSDVLPDCRKKGIHTYGSTVAIEFIADGTSPFTGLFQGVSYGMARLSLAAKPSATSTVPGIGVKFLVDGRPSLNFVAMYSLDGQPSYNFFANEFSTFINPTTSGPLKILAAAFSTATQDPTKVDVAYMAKVNQDGSTVSAPVAPEKLILVPNRSQLEFDAASHEVRDDLGTIASGTTLYSVYGVMAGGGGRIYIGRIVSSSRFIASQFGDQKLFFRHQRFNNQ